MRERDERPSALRHGLPLYPADPASTFEAAESASQRFVCAEIDETVEDHLIPRISLSDAQGLAVPENRQIEWETRDVVIRDPKTAVVTWEKIPNRDVTLPPVDHPVISYDQPGHVKGTIRKSRPTWKSARTLLNTQIPERIEDVTRDLKFDRPVIQNLAGKTVTGHYERDYNQREYIDVFEQAVSPDDAYNELDELGLGHLKR